MAESRCKLILRALKARLEAIRTANGFFTEAGTHVEHGPLIVSPHDPMPRLAIAGGPITLEANLNSGTRGLAFTVTGLIAEDADPLVLEDLRADITRALFLGGDRSLGGLGHGGGLDYTGSSVTAREEGGRHVVCVVTGVMYYDEEYGEP